MGQARDKQGNLWETDANGDGVRMIAPAPSAPAQGGIFSLPPDPAKQASEARAAADEQRRAAEWNASHNPDGTPKVQAPSLLGDPSKTGQAYLATLPQNIRGRVQQLLDGRSMLTAREKGQPLGQQLMDAANQADPTFDENASHARYVERTQYTGQGKGSQVVQAAERIAQHVNDLYAASKALGGPDLGWAPLSNLATGTTNSFRQAKVASYNQILPLISGELQKLTKNGAATMDESNKIEHNLRADQPEDVRYAAMKELVRLGRAQYDPLRESWAAAWQGSTPPPMPMDFSPATTAIFDNIEAGGKPLPMKRDKNGALIVPAGGYGGDNNGGNDPSLTPASGDTRTEITQRPIDKKIAAMLAGGAPSANIRAVAATGDYPTGKVESLLAWRAMNPQYKGGYDVHDEKIIPTTAYQRAAASPLAAGIVGATDAATAGLADEGVGAVNALRTGQPVGDAVRSADMSKQMLLNANPKSALAGNVLGGAAAMLGGGAALKGAGLLDSAWLAANPLKAAALGDAAYGAAYGAGENNDNRLLGAGVGGAVGAVASPIGTLGARAVGGALKGVVNPAVDRLRAAGIPLTVGEVLGGGAKKAQDAMTSVFGPGDMVARRYGEGRMALNQAAFNQAGQEVGTPINAVGQQGIEALNTAKSDAYSRALDPISLNLNTPSFVDPMKGVMAGAQAIPQGELPQGYAADTIKRFVGNNIMPNGTMAGRDFQKAYRGLSQTAAKAAPKVEGNDISEALAQAKDILASNLQDQNPGAFGDFLRANSANRHLNVLAKAVDSAKSQIDDNGNMLFTPAQLGTAASQNGRAYGGNIANASGARPFNQLATDAQQVMSSKLPDSGTGKRLAMLALATGGTGTAGYGAGGGEGAAEGAAVPLGLLTLLGTRRGQAALTNALIRRAAPFRIAGSKIGQNAQIGGSILAAAGIPLLSGE